MKKNRHRGTSPGDVRTGRVHIEFNHTGAKAVAIAGTFNDWRPDASPMVPLGDGRWAKELVLPPGTYEYRIVVDGAWFADPLAAETVPNPFGGLNSVLRVPSGGGSHRS